MAYFLALLAEKNPDLAQVVEAWPKLPEHIKAAIRALIDTFKDAPKDEAAEGAR